MVMAVTEKKRISPFRELLLLMHEYGLVLLGNRKELEGILIFPVLAMLITVWIAGKNMFVNYESTKSACFVLVSSAIWGGLFNSIQTVVKERKIVQRNLVNSGMRLSCYIASRAVIQFLFCAMQSGILLIAFPGVDMIYGNTLPEHGILFSVPLVEYYISLLLLMYAADTMGLMISCVVRKPESASVAAPYILIVQLIFSGILFSMDGMSEVVSYIMLSRWGMEALGSISKLNDLPLRIQETVPTIPHEVEDMFLSSGNHLRNVWGVLLVFSLTFLIMGGILLNRVKLDER